MKKRRLNRIFCVCLCVQKSIFEDVALGTIIVSVSATDADSGLFSVIEYGLVDGEGKFGITPTTVSVFGVKTKQRQ